MKKDQLIFLEDIKDCIEKIKEYTKNVSWESFEKDVKLQDAVIRRLEIIGEAVKGITPLLRENHPEIPWKQVAGFRDVLIHAYSGVNLKMVWNVIKTDLPALKEHVEKIIEMKN
jgi:uncharacterized protein with HEPN domain